MHQLELTTIKRQWLDEASATFALRGHTMGTFTAEDLREMLPPPPHINYHGVLIAQLAKAGLIDCVGFVTSKRREANGRKISQWRAK